MATRCKPAVKILDCISSSAKRRCSVRTVFGRRSSLNACQQLFLPITQTTAHRRLESRSVSAQQLTSRLACLPSYQHQLCTSIACTRVAKAAPSGPGLVGSVNTWQVRHFSRTFTNDGREFVNVPIHDSFHDFSLPRCLHSQRKFTTP